MTEQKRRGVRCQVYRHLVDDETAKALNGERGVAGNRGIVHTTNGPTRTVDQVTLIGEGIPEKDEPTEDAPAYRLDRITFGKRDRIFARPDDDVVRYQAGGNFLFGGNGYPFEFAILVHDRTEKPRD